MNNDDFDELLEKVRKGLATPEEKLEFLKQLNESMERFDAVLQNAIQDVE